MSNADQSSNLPNPGTELAKERNRAAEERTLMAWIRTALSLIGVRLWYRSHRRRHPNIPGRCGKSHPSDSHPGFVIYRLRHVCHAVCRP
jgi:hypothetical protein